MDWDVSAQKVSEHVRFIRSVDWAATALGPPSSWPQSLHQMLDLILADPTPCAIMWGDSLTMLYNEGFVEFAGSKHPKLMGGTPVVEYAEVWEPMFAPIIKEGRETGAATRHEDVRLLLERHGYLEEVFVTYTFVPILGADKDVIGFYHTAVETTNEAISARRQGTLLALGDYAGSARNIDQYWSGVMKGFETNPVDTPYVVAYSFRDGSDNESISSDCSSTSPSSFVMRVPRSCTFVSATGKSPTQIPLSFDVQDETDEFICRVRKCIQSGTSVRLSREDNTLPNWLFERKVALDDREPCTSVLVVPIKPTTRYDTEGKNSIGFLIVGLSPLSRWNIEYEQWTRLWTRQLVTSAASVVLLEQEVARQAHLAEQLVISARTAQETEYRFSRFAEMADVAMWIVDVNGLVQYANRAWREQSGLYQSSPNISAWLNIVSEDTFGAVDKQWKRVIDERIPQTIEAKLKQSYTTTDKLTGQKQPRSRWVLCSVFPEVGSDGALKAVWGCNTDISHQKNVEGLKEQRLHDVLEAKRQSENFIDMTSHEMRNPLSAIIQCADGITTMLRDTKKAVLQKGGNTESAADLDAMLDLAQTITLCGQHQTRVVNDILTLSKLDSSLLTVSAIAINPVSTLEHALKLHQQELRNAQVESILDVHDSYRAMQIDMALLDPSRLLQVLINLITNAIKLCVSRLIDHKTLSNLTFQHSVSRSTSLDITSRSFANKPRHGRQILHASDLESSSSDRS